MIQAIAYDTVVELKILSSKTKDDFDEDLERIKTDFALNDREFILGRRVFVIRNPKIYLHIPYIKAALEDRARQLVFAGL
jgi:hypothetical protein